MVVEPKGCASFPWPTFRPRMHFEAGVEKIGSRAEIVLQKCIFLVSLEFCIAKVQSGKMKACVQSFKYKGFTIYEKRTSFKRKKSCRLPTCLPNANGWLSITRAYGTLEKSKFYKFIIFRLMTELTTPLECLFANVDMESTEQGANTLFELKQHLTDIKNVFLDPKISKSILSNMEKILEKQKGDTMGFREKHTMVNSVTLIRNILHIPEDGQEGSDTSNPSESPDCTSGEGNSGSGDSPVQLVNYGDSEENKQVNNRLRK